MKETKATKLLKCLKMKVFTVIFLAGYITCINSYSIIQVPEDPTPTFKVIWNVPTFQCKSKSIPFTHIHRDFGIVQNVGDQFRGAKVTILYADTFVPFGIPQRWNMEKYLAIFKSEVEKHIPNEAFDGFGIIDMERWRPVYNQNFGNPSFIKNESYHLEKESHDGWKEPWLQAEAKRNFELSARQLMESFLVTAKEMRPLAQWGYYGFPYCFNMEGKYMRQTCTNETRKENDETYWLWGESTALYPSLYSRSELSSSQLASLIKERVVESKRVAAKETTVLPYFSLTYRNGGFFTQKDLNTALDTLHKSNASGVIIWGASKEVNTPDKCKTLLKYVNEVFGPTVIKYTKPKVDINTHKPDITSEIVPRTHITEQGQNPSLVDLILKNIGNTTNSHKDDITIIVIHKSYYSPNALAPVGNANYNCSYPTPIQINFNEIHIHNSNNTGVVDSNKDIAIKNKTTNMVNSINTISRTEDNHKRDRSTEEKTIGESSPTENYTGERSTEDNNIVDRSTEENTIGESSPTENYTGERSTEDNDIVDRSTEENTIGESSPTENYTGERSTEDNEIVDRSTEENTIGESSPTENYTGERSTEDNEIVNRSTEENTIGESSPTENYTGERSTEGNHLIDGSTENNTIGESSTTENYIGVSSTEENKQIK